MKSRYKLALLTAVMLTLLIVRPVLASHSEEAGLHNFGMTFLWIAILLLAAKFSGLVERFGQPSVLGELLMGVLLGNLVLVGIYVFEPMQSDAVLIFLAELGVVILLFQVGLESNISEMSKVGLSAILVATAGVIVPFVLGVYLVGPLLLPGLDFYTYLFLGAALTATSVGITARVFRDLGAIRSSEAKIVMGAAVIDDVAGLILLAVVSAMVTFGTVDVSQVGWILSKAILFLVGAIVLGQHLAPRIGLLFSRINPGTGMKFTLAIGTCLIFAYLAGCLGLAPIVGAFAAGLVLDPVHFRSFKDPEIIDDLKSTVDTTTPGVGEAVSKVIETHSERHINDLIEPLGHFFIPIFFIMTGMAVRLDTLFNIPVLLVALGITLVAFLGKLVAGYVAVGNVSRSIIGWSMVPRGEVGLIFAATGKALGVISDQVFSVIVIMVILTTLIAPPALSYILKRKNRSSSGGLKRPKRRPASILTKHL
jgi:Kef-type K+ transport system membrane component KefB